MGKKLKGGRRQILQLEEKKPPKVPSKSKVKSLIHYSDSDDDSKKSNESESSTSAAAAETKEPLESQIADFFKEIDALSVPNELLEEPDKATSTSKAETTNENTPAPEACSSETAVDLPASVSKDDTESDATNKEPYCLWQEICDSSTGYSYYWNVETNEVTWDCPPEYAAYIQSFNASTEKTNHTTKNKNADVKEKKKKKNDVVLPEGAIIPISYFGNSSSSDDSSDSEKELSKKKPKKPEKVSEPKKNKTIKKTDSKSKTNEEVSEIIGPSLPPDFQFPVTESAANETESVMAASENEVDEFVCIGPSLPPETLNGEVETPSQSDIDELPAESSTNGVEHRESTITHVEKKYAELKKRKEKTGNASPDSTEKKVFRPVVEYDSFTDEDEEISVANISSSKPNTHEKHYEAKSSKQQEQDNTTGSSILNKMLVETESEVCGFKRKASEVLKENSKKEELIKKPKRNDVNIDSLFASHSSYGKYGFGFGWQKPFDEQDEELCSTTNQDYKTYKHQREFKAVSFVKSEDVLDLKALNDEIVNDEPKHSLPDESVSTNIECDQSNALEQNEKPSLNAVEENEKPLLNKEELVEKAAANENTKVASDCDVGSSTMISIKDKLHSSILSKKRKNGKFLFNAASTSLKVEEDLEEIDKALCEALDAKKSANNLSQKSSSPDSDVPNIPKIVIESTSDAESEEKPKEAEADDENASDADAITDDILEISSELIDKLTFLLSTPATHSSFSGVFFQLQTRFVDWQAGALDSKYFMSRLKELEQYIQHYETGVISGEWTYQWDREHKRYFFTNTRTQHSQWTYPEEICIQDKSSWPQSQVEAGPSSASSFAADRDDVQTVSSSSTMQENEDPKHSSSFNFDSKDNSSAARWILQSSPPPPPPGVDSPPPPPCTPPPQSPPPPPPDSTEETLREPEDMDLENSNDSSSFLFVNNKTMTDDGRMQFISMVDQSSQRSPVSFGNASLFSAVSSTSMPGCEDISAAPRLSPVPHSLESSEVNNVHWSQPSCSSQVKVSSNSTGSVLNTDVPPNLLESSEVPASSSNGVCSSQSDVVHLKPSKSGNAVSKKEKKKTKIQPGLGLKKKNIPSLVEKWQKIKEQQDREDKNPDDCKNGNSF